jgi:hypothetical protein
MAVLLTRRCSAGRFGGTEGVVKFRGEEVGFNKNILIIILNILNIFSYNKERCHLLT